MATVIAAVNERAFNDVVMATAKYLEGLPPFEGSGDFGPFSASYSIGFKLTGGSVDLTSAGRVHLDELKLTYDPFILELGIDLPHIQFGGECIIPNPFGGCLVRLPRIDIFGDDPDISIPINLSGTLVSEFSGEFTVSTALQVLVAKGALLPHAAHATADTSNEIRDRFRGVIGSIPLLPNAAVNTIADSFVPLVKGNLADKQQFFLRDVWHDFDLISVADTAANLLRNLVDLIIDSVLAPVPAIFRNAIKWILHPIIDAIGAILDIPDDILEWLSSQLQLSFGLFDMVAQLVVNVIGSVVPVFQFENPYPLIEDTSGLIPVLIPVRDVAVTVDDDEFVVSADLG